MLTVTARIFKDNQLVGYRLSDGNREQDFTKQQAWMYAKNKQILNVVATGTEEDPGLSGTNGFELKKLPEVKWQDVNFKFSDEDILAAFIRNAIANNRIDCMGSDHKSKFSYIKKHIKNELDAGILDTSIIRTISASIAVEHTLYDAMQKGGEIAFVPGKGLSPVPSIIGYEIRNIGDKPISITRMTITPDHTTSEIVLNVNEAIYINRAEMTLLASKPEVGCTFANGKMLLSMKKDMLQDETYELISKLVKFNFCKSNLSSNGITPEIHVHANNIKLDVRKVLDAETVDEYFCPPLKSNVPANKQKEAQAQNTIQKINKQGIFKGFSR